MELKIPSKFKTVLDRNRPLSGLVYSSIHEFGEWLKQNNTKFFAEYTDHSLEHIEKVLETADSLIRNECRKYLTEYDIATLILATLLHDCAMHLSEDGFINLVKEDGKTKIDGFGDKPWNLLWADFLAESRRFSGRKLIALFGDADSIRHPPLDDPDQLNGKDLLLCGEFLRRHHARLAHEIALFGVPGPSGRNLKLPTTDDTSDIADLAGIVARSHGLSIRDCLDYLQTNYSSIKEPRGVHVPFLMAVLRIADILQIQSNRAPKQVLKVRQLKSPVSSGEWEMHQAIKNMSSKEYSETIWIEAKPKNARTYLRIRSLLDQIQSELDLSWTTIGEIYGYDPEFREFGLKARRIRSNIDDVDRFSKQIKYLPIQASFEVADSDLLKLLIGPLYGEKAEIGIRELMQNAVDAVNEFQEYKIQLQHELLEVPIQDGDVVISINKQEDGEWWLTVRDHGIGMTINTVKEYFLKAGASLRRSEIWKKTFEDENGNSKVLRSGRFGIGALAAFLIGDQIKVNTRHASGTSDDGIEFIAQLDTEAIEIKRVNRAIGTTVSVRMQKDAIESLVAMPDDNKWTEREKDRKWDWYCLQKPSITRKVNQINLEQRISVPELNSNLPLGWHRIHLPGFEDIHWSYLPDLPRLICNGIVVGGNDNQSGPNINRLQDKHIGFSNPALSVFDFNANLPLNIQRTDLTVKNLPFQQKLLEDVIRDFITYILVEAPTSVSQNEKTIQPVDYYANMYDITPSFRAPDFPVWISTNLGTGIFCDPLIFKKLDKKSTCVAFYYTNKLNPPQVSIQHETILHIPLNNTRRNMNILASLNDTIISGLGISVLPLDQNVSYAMRLNPYGNLVGAARLLVNKKIIASIDNYRQYAKFNVDILQNIDNFTLPFFGVEEDLSLEYITKMQLERATKVVEQEWEDDNWVILKSGECPPPQFDFEQFAKINIDVDYTKWPCVIGEWYFAENPLKDEPSVFAQIWDDLIQSPVIPYELAERKMKLSHAYEELKTNIENYQATKEFIEAENKKRFEEE